jgi:hypothetical protein
LRLKNEHLKELRRFLGCLRLLELVEGFEIVELINVILAYPFSPIPTLVLPLPICNPSRITFGIGTSEYPETVVVYVIEPCVNPDSSIVLTYDDPLPPHPVAPLLPPPPPYHPPPPPPPHGPPFPDVRLERYELDPPP